MRRTGQFGAIAHQIQDRHRADYARGNHPLILRLQHIGIGRRHAGTDVVILVHDLHIRVLNHHGELLRELQLDPTKHYQPQA